MRAPSQLKLETATVYTVRSRFLIDGHHYVPDELVDGDVARAWPTFRSLLGVHWLIPSTATVSDHSARNTGSTTTPRARSKPRPKKALAA